MRTSLNEIKLIEKYLAGKLPPEERLLIEARMITEPGFRLNVFLQRKIHQIMVMYQNRKIKKTLDAYHRTFFHDPARQSYKEKIINLFQS